MTVVIVETSNGKLMKMYRYEKKGEKWFLPCLACALNGSCAIFYHLPRAANRIVEGLGRGGRRTGTNPVIMSSFHVIFPFGWNSLAFRYIYFVTSFLWYSPQPEPLSLTTLSLRQREWRLWVWHFSSFVINQAPSSDSAGACASLTYFHFISIM